jgi:clan AA aspartic protease (TIGR02281 family)
MEWKIGTHPIFQDKILHQKMGCVPIFLATAFLLCAAGSDAATIHLRNKRKMEGEIKSETDKFVVVELGFGEAVVSREDIEFIDETISPPGAEMVSLPEELQGLSEELREVKKKKIEAVKYKSRHDQLVYKIANLERALSDFNSKFENLNNRLRRMKRDDVYAYNKVVAEINTTNSKLGSTIEDLKQSVKMKEESNPDVSKRISEYGEALNSLEKAFEEKYGRIKTGKKVTGELEKTHYESMDEEIKRLAMDFRRFEVGYTAKGSHVIVETLLDNRVKANLMLDTGASSIVVSRKVADELNVKDGYGTRKGTFVLADGRKITATVFTLQSVRVGDSRVENVAASISESDQEPDIDGLLGMSFLGNFIFRIDSKANKLILEEFTPR